jgi:hypothetical protein
MMLLKLVFLDSTVSLERLFSQLGAAPETPGPEGAGAEKKSDVTAPSRPPAPEYPVPAPQGPAVIAAPARSSPEPPGGHDGAAPCGNAAGGEPDDFDEPAAADPHDVRRRWPAFIEALMHDRPNLGTFLSLAAVADACGSSIDLVYDRQHRFPFSEVTKKSNRDEIARMMKSFFGRPVEAHITLEPGRAAAGKAGSPPEPRRPAGIQSEIESEPVIRSVLEFFDGEIIR